MSSTNTQSSTETSESHSLVSILVEEEENINQISSTTSSEENSKDNNLIENEKRTGNLFSSTINFLNTVLGGATLSF